MAVHRSDSGYQEVEITESTGPYSIANAVNPAIRVNNQVDAVPAVQITQRANTGASTSTGGSINLDNSLSTGAGLVIFSSQAAPSGRLLVVRASSPTFNQNAAYFENAGTGHALYAANTYSGTNATGSAVNVTSSNPGASAVQVGGVETGRGTIKVTHTATSGDANASGLSIDLQGAGTASQGIHIDSVANGTTGALLDMRNNGNQLFKFQSDATFAIPTMVLGNGGPIVTICVGTPEGAVTGPVGSLALRTDGGVSTTLYVKQAGTGNTGWVAK